jgi:hypothetical protein
MRVSDMIERGRGSERSARVAVIGTCRVHDPFERLVSLGRAMPVWANPHSVTHTLGETKQIIDYTLGRIEIPSVLRSFIFDSPNPPPLAPVGRRILESADTVIVEIADLRQVRYQSFYFHLNFFWTSFVSRYGAPVLDWNRAFSRGESISDDTVAATLAKLGDLSPDELAFAETVLRNTMLQRLDVDSMASAIEDTLFDRSKRWVFVSHFVVPGMSGAQMRDRAELVDTLRQATSRRGLSIFDPTPLIVRHGLEVSLAKNGSDIYHYNPAFNEVVADALLEAAGLDPARPARGIPSSPSANSNGRTTTPLAAETIERVNSVLVPLHRCRVEELGIDKSGLYDHYKYRLDRAEIADPGVAALARLIVGILPPFDSYHVLRAGLGELAFVLAALGLHAAAFDQDTNRFAAIAAGLEAFAETELAGLITIGNNYIPEVTDRNKTLAIAHHLINHAPRTEEDALAALARYRAVLIEPRIFLRMRAAVEQREEVIDQFRARGFSIVREFPQSGLVYCARPDLPDATG